MFYLSFYQISQVSHLFQPENLLSKNSEEYAPTVLADFYMSSLMSHGVLMNGVCGNPSYVGTFIKDRALCCDL